MFSWKFPFCKMFLSVPCIHYKLMKLDFASYLLLSLRSWWEQLLGKTYGLQCQDGAMVSDSSSFKKIKSCRQNSLLVLRLTSVIRCFCDWMTCGKSWMIKTIYNQTLHETLRQNRLYYNNVAVGNWNSN